MAAIPAVFAAIDPIFHAVPVTATVAAVPAILPTIESIFNPVSDFGRMCSGRDDHRMTVRWGGGNAGTKEEAGGSECDDGFHRYLIRHG